MKTIKMVVFSVALVAFGYNVEAQEHKVVKAGYGVPVVQTEPEFPGGQDSLKQFIRENLRYPQALKENREGGKVVLMFIVDKEGKIIDPVVLKGVNKDINEEAMRLLGLMPDWIPATAGGQPVNRQFVLPIDFIPPGI